MFHWIADIFIKWKKTQVEGSKRRNILYDQSLQCIRISPTSKVQRSMHISQLYRFVLAFLECGIMQVFLFARLE